MAFAGGDPTDLRAVAVTLTTLSGDLTADALAMASQGRSAAADAGDGQVADLAETALAALGGAVLATATLVSGLAQGSTTAADQLVTATGLPQ